MAPKALTAASVDHLRPRATRYEVSDAKARSLRVVVHPSGRVRFIVRYRRPDSGKTAKLTLKAGTSLAEARVVAAEAMAALERGHDPAAAKKDAKVKAELAAANTLRATAEIYLTREERKPVEKRLRTIGQRRSTFERLIYPKLGGRPIAEIRRSEIVALLDDVEAKRGGRMADGVLEALRILFDWHARRDDDFRTPVVRGMTITKPKDRMRNRALTDDELRSVWGACDHVGLFGIYVRFTLLTATRRNESAHLKWSEISNGDWTIPAARYKSKVDHLIPLSKAARDLLAGLSKVSGCEFVFSGDGKRPIAGFSAGKRKLDKVSGVTGWRLHDLRRVSRSLLSRAGIAADVGEMCLGHAVGVLRKTYDRYSYRDEKAHAFEALAKLIGRLVDPPAGNVVALRS